ncbi:hypothetical protein [uncultured Jatrophihabitans sp.]|uniref:hypothetical protein n=1 Tax=uncultured Jatrophihabitans sp. TaxID=1610747 RepID=UPI0035CBCDB8
MAADDEFAWLADGGTPEYQIPGAPDSPVAADKLAENSSDATPGGRLVVVTRDGRRTQIDTDLPVRGVEVDGDDVVVIFAERPVAHERNHGWTMQYPTSTLRSTKAQILSGSLNGSSKKRLDTPDFDPDDTFDLLGPESTARWAWLKTDPHVVLRHGVRAAEVIWWVGADSEGDSINRRVLVRGHDPASGQVVIALDAGLGLVGAVRAVGDELWIVVARQRLLRVPNSRGVEVIAVSRNGSVRTVYAPDTIDVSTTQPKLGTRPSETQIQAAVAAIRSQFDHVESYWHDEDGNSYPLADGITEPNVDVRGEWPHTTVAVSLRHPSRPGLVLRRTFAVFNERGQAVEHEYADIYLMEDLDTGYLTPASEAVDGVLTT